MAKLQLNPAQQEKVKKALVTAATGPVGSTMGQAGKVAQTFGLPVFEGEKMPASGMLKEVEITRKPQTKPSSVSLPDVINIGERAYSLDDLVAQGKVLKERFGEGSAMVKLYNNLISGKGGYTALKADARKNPESSVDTLQKQVEIYSPYTDVNKRGYTKPSRKGETSNELGVITTAKGQLKGDIFGGGNNIYELEKFLRERGVKPTRSLGNEQKRGYSRMD